MEQLRNLMKQHPGISKNQKPFLLRIFTSKMMFPFLLCIWFLYFTFARSQTKSLRGTPKFDAVDIYKTDMHDDSSGKLDHLIVVAGHAVLRLSKMNVADTSDAGWYLLSYQQNQGFPAIITSHIKKGLELATKYKKSMLVFSGGQTRRDVGPTSEAASYYYLANDKQLLTNLNERVYLEEYARDSFENLLFSVCRFREVEGYYPSRISVVGFDFKAKRYTDLHRKAIGYPAGNFSYIGVQSPSVFDQARAVKGEEDAYSSFQQDMYGCNDASLSDKRNKRNPFRRTVPYTLACPEMVDLLMWCGPASFDVDVLPWNQKGRIS